MGLLFSPLIPRSTVVAQVTTSPVGWIAPAAEEPLQGTPLRQIVDGLRGNVLTGVFANHYVSFSRLLQAKSSTVLSDPAHRYRLAAQQILGSKSILDVGGYQDRRRILTEVLGDNILYEPLNTSAAWYGNEAHSQLYDGKRFPFGDSSFDAVISVDTFEHIPLEDRDSIIKEMMRVARNRVIVVVPFDRGCLASFEPVFVSLSHALRVVVKPSILEHMKFGLPKIEELAGYVQQYGHEVVFGTNFNLFCLMMYLQLVVNGLCGADMSHRINEMIQALFEPILDIDPSNSSNAYRAIIVMRKS